VRVLLVSTYELGHQPVALAAPAAALERAGHEVRCCDVSVDPLDPADVAWAERVAFSVPMHTALRLALPLAMSIRARRPEVPLCFYGLYATVRTDLALVPTVDAVIAGEYVPGLVAWASGLDAGQPVQLGRRGRGPGTPLPARRLLPSLDRYTRLAGPDGEHLVGSVTTTTGCSHRCRHCPVPVVYDGRVRPVEESAVVADVDQLVAAGARHLTFSDPDFLNMPGHARRIVREVHRRHPELTFDCTVKVEHILRHPDVWPEWRAAGCVFVVSAFESVDDDVLAVLDKGHTASDASAAVTLLRAHGIEIRPSWLPFTPLTTAGTLSDLLDFVIAHDLVANVDPVQYAVRLLLPEGSLLMDRPEIAPFVGAYDPVHLGWSWTHPDPGIDGLYAELSALVEQRVDQDPLVTFGEIEERVSALGGRRRPRPLQGEVSRGPDGARFRLTEPWFCCSEPTAAQLAPLSAPY